MPIAHVPVLASDMLVAQQVPEVPIVSSLSLSSSTHTNPSLGTSDAYSPFDVTGIQTLILL